LIVHAFAGYAKHKDEHDFQISRASLADRLNMTPPGARKVILKLCKDNVIAPTQPCHPQGIGALLLVASAK
jgi:hypothetical protein